MSNEKETDFVISTSVTPNFGDGVDMASTVASSLHGEQDNAEIREIGRQLHTAAAEVIAVAVRAEFAARVSDSFNRRTVSRTDGHVDFIQEILEKKRPDKYQAIMEVVCQSQLTSQINVQSAFRQSVDNALGNIVSRPFDTNTAREDIIIEETPGVIGWIFGGQRTTRVLR